MAPTVPERRDLPSERPKGALLASCMARMDERLQGMDGVHAPAFAGAGITFASIGYRLAPAASVSAGVDDVRRCGLLAAQAPRLGFDAGKLVLGATPPAGTTALSWRCAATGSRAEAARPT